MHFGNDRLMLHSQADQSCESQGTCIDNFIFDVQVKAMAGKVVGFRDLLRRQRCRSFEMFGTNHGVVSDSESNIGILYVSVY